MPGTPRERGGAIQRRHCINEKNNYSEAIDYFENVVKINRTNSTAIYNKGICLFQLDKIEEAFKSFCIVLNMNPKDIECQLYKGICQEKLKNIMKLFKYLIK